MNDLSTRSAKTIKGQFFPAFSELQRTYTVSIAYSGGNTAEATHIRYSVDLRCARLLDNRDYILELARSEECINDADASDNIATALAQSCGRILYPLQLHVSGQGRLLAITNHADILILGRLNTAAQAILFRGARRGLYRPNRPCLVRCKHIPASHGE